MSDSFFPELKLSLRSSFLNHRIIKVGRDYKDHQVQPMSLSATSNGVFYIVVLNFLSLADLTDVVLLTGEKAVPSPGGLLATQSGQTEEPSSKMMVLVTPASVASSVRRTALPAVRKISTAVTYGLDRLESEGTTVPKSKGQAASSGEEQLP